MNMARDDIERRLFRVKRGLFHFDLFIIPLQSDTQTGTLGGRLSNHNVLRKQKTLNNIHKFEGCFLTGQASLTGFNVFNSCIVEP